MISFKIKKTSLLAYIAMVFSFMSAYPIFYGTAGSFLWTLLYYGSVVGLFILSLYYISVNKNLKLSKERKFFIGIFCIPRIIMLLYSIIIWIGMNTAFPYISRGISNTLFQCIAYFCGICFACGERDNILKVTLVSVLSVFGLSYILGFARNGIAFIHAFNPLNPVAYNFVGYTELHELAYILGLYILLRLITDKKSSLKKRDYLFWIAVFAFIVAWKRVGILALIITYLYFLIFNKNGKRDKSFFVKVTGIAATIVCLIFVSLIISGAFTEILGRYGIEMMGRNIIYDYFRKFARFSPLYMGRGVGFVTRQFDYTTRSDLYNMVSIKALHNDLLKMYIEIGFIGFCIWTVWWLVRKPKLLMKKYGVEKAFICLLFIVFSFVLYTTDNTESYTNYQVHLAAIITYISCFYEPRKR